MTIDYLSVSRDGTMHQLLYPEGNIRRALMDAQADLALGLMVVLAPAGGAGVRCTETLDRRR